jgi:hypothetical protein
MSDLVMTLRRDWWQTCIAGQLPSSSRGFYVGGRKPPARSARRSSGEAAPPPVAPGERLYLVAHGRVRGYVPVSGVARTGRGWTIQRGGPAVAVTIPEAVADFRGWRAAWWAVSDEVPFPDWRTADTSDVLEDAEGASEREEAEASPPDGPLFGGRPDG